MNWVEAPDNWWIKREEIINPYYSESSSGWKSCDLVEIEWTLDLNNAPEEANTCTAIRIWGQVYWFDPIYTSCDEKIEFRTRRMYPSSAPGCKPNPFWKDQYDLTAGTPITITWDGEEFNLSNSCIFGESGTFDWLKLQNFTGEGQGSLASTYITKVEMYIDWVPPQPRLFRHTGRTVEYTYTAPPPPPYTTPPPATSSPTPTIPSGSSNPPVSNVTPPSPPPNNQPNGWSNRRIVPCSPGPSGEERSSVWEVDANNNLIRRISPCM